MGLGVGVVTGDSDGVVALGVGDSVGEVGGGLHAGNRLNRSIIGTSQSKHLLTIIILFLLFRFNKPGIIL